MKRISQLLSLVLVLSLLFSQTAQAQEKKRWSPQAKGTVIGLGAGALTGAVINKRNRVVGGAVGGVVGGAAGYAIGKHKDNKNKEAARIAAANRAAAERVAAANRRAELARQEAARAKSGTSAPASAASLAAAQPAGLYATKGSAMPQTASAAFLPNTSYGDRSTPYSTSEYRRKSW
ncbi:glycine zipper domain-containing protein [Hymenobacter cavernae]|nr:glycine zipper domain-containing protein [Hymenobacter cavernae]